MHYLDCTNNEIIIITKMRRKYVLLSIYVYVLWINEKKKKWLWNSLTFFGWVCYCFDFKWRKNLVFEEMIQLANLKTMAWTLCWAIFPLCSISFSVSLFFSRDGLLCDAEARWTFYLFRNLRIWTTVCTILFEFSVERKMCRIFLSMKLKRKLAQRSTKYKS